MSFSRLLRKFSQPSLSHPAPAGSGNSPRISSDDPHERSRRQEASEPMPAIPRPWRRKRPSTMGRSIQSQTTSTPLLIPKVESPTPDVEVPEMPLPMPLPTSPGVLLTNLTVEPPPEMIPAVVPAPDKLAEAWDAVKADPTIAKPSRELDSVGSVSVSLPLYLGKLILACRRYSRYSTRSRRAILACRNGDGRSCRTNRPGKDHKGGN